MHSLIEGALILGFWVREARSKSGNMWSNSRVSNIYSWLNKCKIKLYIDRKYLSFSLLLLLFSIILSSLLSLFWLSSFFIIIVVGQHFYHYSLHYNNNQTVRGLFAGPICTLYCIVLTRQWVILRWALWAVLCGSSMVMWLSSQWVILEGDGTTAVRTVS